MDKKSVPILMARLSTYSNTWSEYGHIRVSFSLVSEFGFGATPKFINYDFDLPKRFHGVDDLFINSQFGSEEINDKGKDGIYGFKLALDFREPEFGHELEKAISSGKSILRKMQKLEDSEGEARTFVEYLKQMFRVMGVKCITYESLSESKFHRKWHVYKIADLPYLIDEAINECANQKNWNLKKELVA